MNISNYLQEEELKNIKEYRERYIEFVNRRISFIFSILTIDSVILGSSLGLFSFLDIHSEKLVLWGIVFFVFSLIVGIVLIIIEYEIERYKEKYSFYFKLNTTQIEIESMNGKIDESEKIYYYLANYDLYFKMLKGKGLENVIKPEKYEIVKKYYKRLPSFSFFEDKKIDKLIKFDWRKKFFIYFDKNRLKVFYLFLILNIMGFSLFLINLFLKIK